MTFPLAASPLKYLYFETSSWKTRGFGAVVIPPQSGWDLRIILLSKIGAWAAPLCSLQWFFCRKTGVGLGSKLASSALKCREFFTVLEDLKSLGLF